MFKQFITATLSLTLLMSGEPNTIHACSGEYVILYEGNDVTDPNLSVTIVDKVISV